MCEVIVQLMIEGRLISFQSLYNKCPRVETIFKLRISFRRLSLDEQIVQP